MQRNKQINKIIAIIPAILGILLATGNTQAATFDPNFIISDEEMLDSTSMTLTDIEEFLKNKGGYISKNKFKDANGEYKSAAQIIYGAANNHDCSGVSISSTAAKSEKDLKCKKITINPKLLLVLLQKEQSLITEQNPTQRQLDWACGYGCPDGQACNTRWEGIGKQINSAALQFFDYLENPHHYSYRAGNTYTVSNTGRPASLVTPVNKATAALYNYTPHVYNGNFSFYTLWMKYFTRMYPNNTLMQAKGEPGIWIIKNGKKRPFLSKGALTSRYDINKVIQVNKSDLDKYPTGSPIKFPQYSLVRSPRGTIFLLVDDKRRGFTSSEAFRKIGFNPEEVMDASWDDINSYEEGPHITATSSYPTGALLQDNKSGGIFYVTEGTKAPLWDAVLLKTKFKGKLITAVTPEKLASYKTVEPAIFNDGELLKSSASPAVYVIDNNKRRPIASGKVFEELGYKWSNIIIVPPKIINLYEEGEALREIFTDEEVVVLDSETSTSTSTATTTLDVASTTKKASTTPDSALEEEINNILNP